jgi:hypothetical protein
MSAAPTDTSAEPAVTAQDLELERAELLPARETLLVPQVYPRLSQPYPHLYPWGSVHPNPGGPVRPWAINGNPVHA